MILCVGNVLDAETLAELGGRLSPAAFEDGRRTAGWHARAVKRNRQLVPGTLPESLLQKIRARLAGDEVVRAAALPRQWSPLLFSRYEVGMDYGTHVDDAIMGLGSGAGEMRSDLSFTLFLSSPDDYEGGELVMDTAGQEASYKLPAGALVLYPSTTLHRVAPVTGGERLAAVGWIQSAVRDPAAREILFDLDRARRQLFESEGKSPAFDLVAKSYANLLRRWAEL